MKPRLILPMILFGCLSFSLLTGVAFASTTITRYVILVSGSLDPLIECTQYDTQYMYHVLVDHYNILEDNISIYTPTLLTPTEELTPKPQRQTLDTQ